MAADFFTEAERAANICLLWGDWQIQSWWSCMNKAEWASWIQAVGVIATILITYLISTYSYRRAKDDKKRILEMDAQIDAMQIISSLCTTDTYLKNLKKVVRKIPSNHLYIYLFHESKKIVLPEVELAGRFSQIDIECANNLIIAIESKKQIMNQISYVLEKQEGNFSKNRDAIFALLDMLVINTEKSKEYILFFLKNRGISLFGINDLNEEVSSPLSMPDELFLNPTRSSN